MRNILEIPDIPDILRKISQACPVANTVSIELDSETPNVVKFYWKFEIKKKRYEQRLEVFSIDTYKPSFIETLQRSIIQLKRKIERISKTI